MRPGNRAIPSSIANDVVELLFKSVNRVRLIFKLFYFFFFAAYGALFPLLALYFKQLGMNPTQSGMLVGFRPFVEFFSAPLWGGLADRWKRGKTLLMIALLSWILFTISIAFVRPKTEGCVVWNNSTTSFVHYHSLEKPVGHVPLLHGDGGMKHVDEEGFNANQLSFGKSPVSLNSSRNLHLNVDGLGEQNIKDLVTPRHTNVVYHQERINQVFIVLLVIIIVGEFFCAPAISLADTAVLSHLSNEEVHGSSSYGRQRMFGSVGWGLSMLLIGIVLDQTSVYHSHPCGHMAKREKNYIISFAVFTVFMSFACLTATQLTFPHDTEEENAKSGAGGKVNCFSGVKEKIFGSSSSLPDDKQILTDNEIIEKQLQIKLEPQEPDAVSDTLEPYADVNASHQQFSKWVMALRLFTTPHLLAFLFVALFMGMGMGLVFTFLFWHLQDLGGQPTLFGLASAMNHGSEILAYFFSNKLINKIGHVKVLYLGLFANAFRFIYVSLLRKPWWVLPIECIQGLTHATVWSACIFYVGKAIPREFRTSSQGLLQGIHHGLGKALGAVLGGVLTSAYGSEAMFRAYGIACLVVLLGYFLLHHFMPETLETSSVDDRWIKQVGQPDEYNSKEDSSTVKTKLNPPGTPGTRYGLEETWEKPGVNQKDLKDALHQLH
jgi:MFS family permease